MIPSGSWTTTSMNGRKKLPAGGTPSQAGIRLGQPVSIQVARANLDRKQLDLSSHDSGLPAGSQYGTAFSAQPECNAQIGVANGDPTRKEALPAFFNAANKL